MGQGPPGLSPIPVPFVPMDLLILRHGRAEDRGGGIPDGERHLIKKGIRDIRLVSRWMVRAGTVPDLIVSSPLVRARETAETVAKETGLQGGITLWEELRPGAASSAVAARFGELAGATLPLITGHEPQLSSLLAFLIGAETDARINLEKGGIAMVGDFAPGLGDTGSLQWLLTPRTIRDMR